MPEKRHIISHKDGRSYSVTHDAFATIYEPQGFKLGDEETPADFVVTGIPKPPRRSSRPVRHKAAAPLAPEPEAAGE